MKPGYTVSQWQRLRGEELTFLQDAATSLTPFGGLTSNALTHLRKDWITWYDDYIKIDIPATAPCNSLKLSSGGTDCRNPPPVVHRNTPCRTCRKKGITNQFENYWRGVDNDKVERYTAILHRELSQPAVDFLSRVFRTYGRPELAVTRSALTQAVNQLDGVTGDKTFSYSKLLRTGPVIYCHYGLSKDDITQLSPYAQDSIQQIIHRTPSVNFSKTSTQAFLRTVQENEPITVSSLAEKIGNNRPATHERLTELLKENRVIVSDNEPGPPAATWEITVPWSDPFECEKCDFISHSLIGIRTHRTEVHS